VAGRFVRRSGDGELPGPFGTSEESPLADHPNAPLRLRFRPAEVRDLAAIVALLADDDLGRNREQAPTDLGAPLEPCYARAFAAIEADRNQQALVAEHAGRIVGYLQITFIPGLSRRGAWRGLIESVRIGADHRNRGAGRALMQHAIAICRARGCALVQLTTDKRRRDAHRFYVRLGFIGSHEGFKLEL
jgi:GNAT superfamily N-acetyltransferase